MSENLINLTKETFDKIIAESAEPVLVDFWAAWCGPCRMVGPVIEELADEYAGKAVVAKVNVDEQPELASKFRVMSIPTVLVFKNGQSTGKAVGARPKAEFKAMIENNL